MGTGVSQAENVDTSMTPEPTDDIKNRKGGTPNTDIVDFNSEIKSPDKARRSTVKEEPPFPKPDISSMDDEQAYQTVRSELDQALAGHYTFFLSSQPQGKPPSVHDLEKLLEEQGYKNPDLSDAKQRQVIKSVLLNKKTAKDPITAMPAVRKGSLSKLEAVPTSMPPLSPINIRGGGWARPQSLVEKEEELRKKFNKKKGAKNSAKNNQESQMKQPGFDVTKFAAANVSPLQKDLDIYKETTYKTYNKKTNEVKPSVDTAPRPRLSPKDLARNYNPSEEALLASIENEYS